MFGFERVWDWQNRTAVLTVSFLIMIVIAVVDWRTKPFVSLGFLYLFPIMLAAGFLPRWAVALLGLSCACLAEAFSALSGSFTRLFPEALAPGGCGLFALELVRNHRMTLEVQARLRALVETSPAAIVTVDERGSIELANGAAVSLMAPRGGNLAGNPIAAFLPELHHALRWEEAPQFRASARLEIIVPITIFLIFIILYTMFRSFKWASLIMVNVMVAPIGGILALLFTHTNFSVSSGVGFLALFGVCVQTGVIMLEYINQLRARGHTAIDSAVEGAVLRLRPIMMTSLVATLGLLPAATSHGIGSDSQRPFAIVIVGGLIAALLLSIMLLPTIYVWIARDTDVLPEPEAGFEESV